MKHICFFYILKYRSIRDVGIILDARYRYVVNEKRKTISITEGNRTASSLWPVGISSFAAIVGNNGAGKSTCMLYMLQTMAQGSGEKDPEAIVIYQDEDGMHVYIPQASGYSLDKRTQDICRVTYDCPHVDMFYYSSYFRPYQYAHEPGEGELAGVYNASDTWRLIKDYQDYANVDATYRTEPIGYHLDAMKSQDDNRIVQLLYDNELRKLLPRNALPRYIIVEPNMSGYRRTWFEESKRNPNDVDLYVPQFGASKDDRLACIVTMILYNIGVECGKSYPAIKNDIERWAQAFWSNKDIVSALAMFMQEPHLEIQFTREMQEIVVFLSKACEYAPVTNSLYIDMQLIKNKENMERLRSYYMYKSFVTAHYFDLGYAHRRSSATQLSSGEFDMLKFFSRIYDAVFEFPRRFDNIYSPQLILIDEAENSYHPEWQRKFVNLLLKFMHAVHFRCKGDKDFQIVLTTHSPILLSDIPNACVNYLEKRQTAVQVVKNQPETFGTNVFELYKHAFFMKEGLIGEFAQNKILAIQYAIENQTQPVGEIIDAIELIGDKAIKAYLLSLLERDFPREMVSYHQRKIKELTERADAADKQK